MLPVPSAAFPARSRLIAMLSCKFPLLQTAFTANQSREECLTVSKTGRPPLAARKNVQQGMHVRATGLRGANDTGKFRKINYDRPLGADGERGNQS